LPFSLGVMGMLKKKSKLKVPNWQKWKDTGIYEYYDNSHTDGYKCSIFHLYKNESTNSWLNITKCRYKSLRYTDRRTAFLIKENPNLIKNYQEWTDYAELFSLNKNEIRNKNTLNIRRDYVDTSLKKRYKLAKYYESINKDYYSLNKTNNNETNID
jgi:hypothetical protein